MKANPLPKDMWVPGLFHCVACNVVIPKGHGRFITLPDVDLPLTTWHGRVCNDVCADAARKEFGVASHA